MIYYATRLQGYPNNYIELSLTFTADGVSTVKWLVFEFHTRDEDLSPLYNTGTPLFPGLRSGDEFPCTAPSAGAFTPTPGQRLICTYFQGDLTGTFGTPHKVFVTNFVITAGTAGTIQFLITNPDVSSGSALRLGVKAYGYDAVGKIFDGQRFYGWRDIENGFDAGGN